MQSKAMQSNAKHSKALSLYTHMCILLSLYIYVFLFIYTYIYIYLSL